MTIYLSRMNIEIDDQAPSIRIVDDLDEELLYWDGNELEASPELVLAIAVAIKMAYTQPDKLREFVEGLRQ